MRLDPSTLHAAGKLAVAATYTAGIVGYSEARERLVAPEDREPIVDRLKQRWCENVIRLFGIHVHTRERSLRTSTEPRLVVCNHRSALDILVLMNAFGGHFVSRNDLAQWPLLGAAASKVGTIYVDRSNAASRATTLRSIRETLSRNRTVLLFPEGTTFAGDVVRSFHGGSFTAAKATHASVVPVGIAYPSDCEMVDEPVGSYLVRMAKRGRIDVALCVGTPRQVQGSTSAFVESTHGEVQALVHDARARLDKRR